MSVHLCVCTFLSFSVCVHISIFLHVLTQAELKKELQVHRQTLLDNMKEQLEEAEELERQVYVVGTKLQTIADVCMLYATLCSYYL